MRPLLVSACFGLLLGCDCIGPAPGDGGMGGGAATGGGGANGGGTGGGSTADAGPSLLDFCARYPKAICGVKVACGVFSDAGFDTCVMQQAHAIADSCGRADAGVARYSPAAAQGCLDETALSPPGCLLAEFGCGINVYVDASPFSNRPGDCGASTCAPGTYCTQDCGDPQCLAGRQPGEGCEEATRPYVLCDVDAGYCRADDGGYGGPTAVCRPWVGLGLPCDYDTCGPGRICDFTNGCRALLPRDAPCMYPSECLDGVCRSTDLRCGALAAGAPCTSPGECGSFNTVNVCVGLTRSPDGGVADAGACGPRPKHGEPCDGDWTFVPTAACPPGDACLDGRCRSLTPFTAPTGSECPTRPWGIVGAAFYGFAYCQAGLTCQRAADAHPPQTGRCAPALALGAPCFDLFNCASLVCLSTDGGQETCQPRAGLHEPCGACFDDLTCEPNDAGASWCVPLHAAGDACFDYYACASGYCDAVCKPYSNGACEYGFTCESGWCSGAQCAPVGTCRATY